MDKSRYSIHKRGRRSRGRIYKPVSVVLILILLVCSVSIFFKVQNIEVRGCNVCTDVSIVAASGIEEGENLVFLDKGKVADSILKSLAYVKEVSVNKKFPSTVVITVVESEAVASIRIGTSIWLIDSKGKLLEKTTADGAQGTITIEGATALAPSVGNKISFGEAEKLKREYLLELLEILYNMGIYEKVSSIDMSNTTNVVFSYDNRFTVSLGQNDSLSDKLSLFVEVLGKLGEYDRGKIDLSVLHEAHFFQTD